MHALKPSEDQRRKLMGVVHKAAKSLNMDEDDRRAMMERITGKRSMSTMNLRQIGDVLDELRALGWVDGKRSKGRRRLASHKEAGKIRALWLSLYHLGEIRDPSEDALATFAKRQTGLDDLEWVKQEHAFKVIEALKSWCERAGYYMPDAGRKEGFTLARNRAGMTNPSDGLCCKFVLIDRIWKLLIAHGAFHTGPMANLGTWLTRQAGVSAPFFMSATEADRAIEELGAWLRRLKKEPEHE